MTVTSRYDGDLHRLIYTDAGKCGGEFQLVAPASSAVYNTSDKPIPAPPPGFPDGHNAAVFPRIHRIPTQGWAVDVTLDVARGTLSFQFDGECLVRPVSPFPRTAALRPFVSMTASHDRVTMTVASRI